MSRLSPRMQGLVERIARAGQLPWHRQSPEQARAAYVRVAEVLDLPRERRVLARDLNLTQPPARAFDAPGQGLPARLYRHPDVDRPAVLLYAHGGGFVIGGLETHDSLCRQLCWRSGVAVLAVDYRLAPEHPFPAAVDDLWSALRWLADGGAAALGLDPSCLAVGGDSAGATLAAVTALQARDAGLALALQLLITPGVAPDDAWPSRRLHAQGVLLDAVTLDWFFDHYAPRARRHDWRYAPLLAPDLAGVAPTALLLAECDPLVDEGLAWGDRLRAEGVAVDLELVRGVTHDFIKMGRALPEALAAQDWAATALAAATGTPRP
jgi:acetyl esterase